MFIIVNRQVYRTKMKYCEIRANINLSQLSSFNIFLGTSTSSLDYIALPVRLSRIEGFFRFTPTRLLLAEKN